MQLQISTGRLVIRRFRPDDAAALNAGARDPRVYRNVATIAPGQSLDDTRGFIARSAAMWDAGTGYGGAVCLGDTPIGTVGGRHDGPHGPFDLGYWIAPDHWGEGYATEAAGAFRDWLHDTLGYRAMTAGHFIDNPASGRVLRKLDFLPAGRRPYPCAGRGEPVACIDMAWIARDALG